MCVVTNSLGICSAGISEQDIMELCKIIYGQASERTGTLLCLPSHGTGSPPSRKSRCGPGREQVVASVAKEVSHISAPADPNHRHRPATKGARDPLGALPHPLSGILPLGSAPCRQRTSKIMCSKSRNPSLRKLPAKCEVPSAPHAGTTRTFFRPIDRGRGTRQEERRRLIHAQNCMYQYLICVCMQCTHINNAPHLLQCRFFRQKASSFHLTERIKSSSSSSDFMLECLTT